MEQNSYNMFSKNGDRAQELFVDFMEKIGHNFLAGDRNGKTVNIDVIEEICRASYIEPKSTFPDRHGPRLFFRKGNRKGYTMPDELFLFNAEDYGYRFFDVKNRSKNTLREEFRKIADYAQIEFYSGIKTYVAIVIWENNGYNIYVRRTSDIYNENVNINEGYVNFCLEDFDKINEYPLRPLHK